MTASLAQRLGAEALGSLFLLAGVVGSGIMGETLSPENDAVALLGNTIATGAVLVVLVTILGPLSGAHLNPAVSLVMMLRGELTTRQLLAYVPSQILGGCLGTLAAHLMFDIPVFQLASTLRTGPGQWFAEFVAAFGLLLTILGCARFKPDAVAMGVGLYITAAYWFTASTSFANPAVTIARALSDTFAGISPAHVPAFVAAQIAGALVGAACWRWLSRGAT